MTGRKQGLYYQIQPLLLRPDPDSEGKLKENNDWINQTEATIYVVKGFVQQ